MQINQENTIIEFNAEPVEGAAQSSTFTVSFSEATVSEYSTLTDEFTIGSVRFTIADTNQIKEIYNKLRAAKTDMGVTSLTANIFCLVDAVPLDLSGNQIDLLRRIETIELDSFGQIRFESHCKWNDDDSARLTYQLFSAVSNKQPQ